MVSAWLEIGSVANNWHLTNSCHCLEAGIRRPAKPICRLVTN